MGQAMGPGEGPSGAAGCSQLGFGAFGFSEMDTAESREPPVTDAAARLATRLGLDPRHFDPAAIRRQPRHYGPRALLRDTRVLDPFAEEAIDGIADPGAMRDALRLHYGKSKERWDAALGRLLDGFFKAEPVPLYSPLDGTMLPCLAEVMGRGMGWLQLLVLDHQPLRILMLQANAPLAIWYPDRACLLLLRSTTPAKAREPRRLLSHIFQAPDAFLSWLEMASRPNARRAFILAEARPAHFMAQSVGFLTRQLESTVLPFLEAGNLLVVLRDRAFLDPLRIFPELRRLPVLSLSFDQAPEILRDLGLNCRLNDRRLVHSSYDWVGRLRGEEQSPDSFAVWISIDAERTRFENEVEGLSACLARIGEAVAASGQRLKVLWDGWTVPSGNKPTDHDRAVMARIAERAAAIREASGATFTEERLYGRSVEEKLALSSGCRLGIATFGTATMLPSFALDVPTVTYHSARFLTPEELTSGYSINGAKAYPVPPEAVTDSATVPVKFHMQKFRVEIPALLAALERALAAAMADASLAESTPAEPVIETSL